VPPGSVKCPAVTAADGDDVLTVVPAAPAAASAGLVGPGRMAAPLFLEPSVPVTAPAADHPGSYQDQDQDQDQDPDADQDPDQAPKAPALPLLAPRDGVPDVVVDAPALAVAAAVLASGTGPIAVDAERASGYRYGQRAYLVQLRRAGAGTVLVDPVAVPDLSSLGVPELDAEWVLHAASQDLPCLAEVGMRPRLLFDTELAGRLAGLERVGLGAMVESVLGYRLEKGHSAADWSTRPLPEPWLRYAALDVELLVELRDALEQDLQEQGKLEWAREEFAAICDAPVKEPLAEPWRRTSGLHQVRSRRQLAAVRRMWEVRDEIARRRDLAPGRVLPDRAIVDAVLAAPASVAALQRLPVFSGPRMRRSAAVWFAALEIARALPDDELPGSGSGSGLPPANRWSDRDAAAAERLLAARAVLSELAGQYGLPAENILEPALLKRLCWAPPQPLDAASVEAALRAGSARQWQLGLVLDPLLAALCA